MYFDLTVIIVSFNCVLVNHYFMEIFIFIPLSLGLDSIGKDDSKLVPSNVEFSGVSFLFRVDKTTLSMFT